MRGWEATCKRALDLALTVVGLAVLALPLAAIALLIKREDGGPVFYRSVRVGRDGRPFRMLKFRTMVPGADRLGGPSTADDDPRITRVGRVLRRGKLDELPQLVNVLTGDMSLVGPRPEVPEYVAMLTEEERAVLRVRPGITDWASLWNRDEGARLAGSLDPEREYRERVRPVKIRLQLEYVRHRSLGTDLAILGQTLAALVRGRRGAGARPPEEAAAAPREGVHARAPGIVDAPRLGAMYATMVRIRKFEECVADLVEAGEIRCPCHLCIGQEAVAAGVCAALERDDYLWGGHRSHGHYLAKGGDPAAMMAELLGKVTGCSAGRGGSMHLFAPEVGILGTVPIVAATIPLAAGAALASALRGDARVSVAFFGDGATEEGHYYETLNLAALYRLPVIFVCENNLYASHMHLRERRREDNIAALAAAHGLPATRLDGNDVWAVYRAAAEAVARARGGGGPSLLECRTFRWRGHVGPAWDVDVGVRRQDELAAWLPRDPLRRARLRLRELNVSETALDAIGVEACAEVANAVVFARESAPPSAGSLLDAVYARGADRV